MTDSINETFLWLPWRNLSLFFNKRKSLFLLLNTSKTSLGNHKRVNKGNKNGSFLEILRKFGEEFKSRCESEPEEKSFHPQFLIAKFFSLLDQIMSAKSVFSFITYIPESYNGAIIRGHLLWPLLLKYFKFPCLRIVSLFMITDRFNTWKRQSGPLN